jgi:uncharacterized membrane protein YfcA
MGFLSALLGIGGGAITVPALVLLPFVAFTMDRAIATSLAVIVPIALSGAFQQRANVAWTAVPALAAAGIVGTFLGTSLKSRVNPRTLMQVFGVFMVCVGVMMILDVKGRLRQWSEARDAAAPVAEAPENPGE